MNLSLHELLLLVMTVPGGLLWPAAAVAIAKAEAGDTEQREFSVAGTVERIHISEVQKKPHK